MTDSDNPTSATLTIDEVAARYRTSRDTIYRWVRGRSDFPKPIHLPTRGVRWTAEQLIAWERQQIAAVNGDTSAA